MIQSSKLPHFRPPFLIAGFLWILLWVIPWGRISAFHENVPVYAFIDMLKLGLAMGMFMLPGYLLFVLLGHDGQQDHDWKDLIPLGFAYSVFLIAVIGLLGRVMGLSFFVVRTTFALFGLVEIMLLGLLHRDAALPRERVGLALVALFRNAPLTLALVIVFLLTLHGNLFFIDDTSYGAYLTNWQFSQELGFENIIHHLGAMEVTRFWLAMYPMGQALLADMSGVPGLLLMGNYLELFLAPAAVLVSYWFVRKLGVSPRLAAFSVLIQVSLYAWMIGNEWPVGTWFYESLAEDKVSVVFFLAPVFFIAALNFIQRPTLNNRLLLIFTGIAVTLTHPVMLFFSCCIVVTFVFFAWIAKQTNLRCLLETCVICIVLMIPYAAIRLSDSTGEISGPYNGTQASTSFQIDQYANIVSDVFYGLNPQVLMFFDISPESGMYSAYQYIRVIPMILMAIGGVIAIRRLQDGPLYWYTLSGTLLVFLATLPYTGWILGYFVSARLLSRISWFAPLGLASVVIIRAAIDWYARSRPARAGAKTVNASNRAVLWGLILCFVFVSPFVLFSVSQRLPEYFKKLEHNRQLAELGIYIDRHTSAPATVIALDYTDLQLIPSASAQADLISFREELEYNGHNNFLPIEEVRARIAASTAIRSMDSSMEKCAALEDYRLRFIVVPIQEEEEYAAALGTCPLTIHVAERTEQLVLFEIR